MTGRPRGLRMSRRDRTRNVPGNSGDGDVLTPSDPRGRPSPASPPELVGHYFRHAYGKLVALLVRRVGVQHLELVEDAVQGALMAALTAWVAKGVPQEPEAWLYRVAHNNLIGDLRRDAARARILASVGDHAEEPAEEMPPRTLTARCGMNCCACCLCAAMRRSRRNPGWRWR